MAMKVKYLVIDGEIISENRAGVEHDYVPDSLGNTVAFSIKPKRFRHIRTGEEQQYRTSRIRFHRGRCPIDRS